MTAEEVAEKVGGKVEVPAEGAAAETVYVGDLLSDVMGHAGEDCALVTIQNHLNTVAVCTRSSSYAIRVPFRLTWRRARRARASR